MYRQYLKFDTMQPYKIEFYIYAETQAEVTEAQKKAHDFITSQFRRGRLVTARKLATALERAKSVPLISEMLSE